MHGPEIAQQEVYTQVPLKTQRSCRHCRETQQRSTVSEFVTALKQCSKSKDLQCGKKLHVDAVVAGYHTNKYVATSLIAMYRKCGSMQSAQEVFDRMTHKDIFVWSSLIQGYVEKGENSVATELFMSMDCAPDSLTIITALKACASLASEKPQFCLENGMGIHRQVKQHGFESDIHVQTTLIDMYSKCGSMRKAQDVFNKMAHRNAVTWTCLIMGYVENGEGSIALELFYKMDCERNGVTFVAGLKACACLACLENGMRIHKELKERGFDSNVVVATTLVDMYSKCGSMSLAREVFEGMQNRNVVSWTCLITGYVENGESSVAIELFTRMDCEPNCVTFVAVLKACASEKALKSGIAIHKELKTRGLESNTAVANTLVDMYSKCGCIQRAKDVFDRMSQRTATSWTCLVLGYVANGESSDALELFRKMDCEANSVTYVAAIKACGCLGALAYGKWIHARVCKAGLGETKQVANCLVDFYGKCGNVLAAEGVFAGIQVPDIVSWNALISGYSMVGDVYQVFKLAGRIHETGLQMNSVTFICILAACSHVGMVEQGVNLFDIMHTHGVDPALKHHACVVDMLGRANKLQEALSIVSGMSFDNVTWTGLLGACKKWKNVEVGKAAFRALSCDNSISASEYIMICDIYESLGSRNA